MARLDEAFCRTSTFARTRRLNVHARSERATRWVPALAALTVLIGVAIGCSKSKRPAIDPQPFQSAIAQYLEGNNMAMAIKEIKEGPDIHGQTATLTASLQHASLPGPAVTWRFRFEQDPDGTWNVVSHQ